MACSKISSKFEDVLKCPICKEIVDKPKTLTCFHSFCNKCLAQFSRTTKEGKSGVSCPLCNAFSGEEHVKSSILVKELLHMHDKLHDGDNTCQQCSKVESKWKCVDCRMNLCEECRGNHLKIPICRKHRIIQCSTEGEMVADGLVVCALHPEELIKFSCHDCSVPLCIQCKVTQHEAHRTETIADTLERILPEIKTNKAKLEEIITTFQQQSEAITSKIEEVKEAFSKSRDEAGNNLNEIIERAKKQHGELVKQLNMKEEEELTKLEIVQTEVETNEKQYKQVCHWVNTCVEASRGVTLMTEIQSGLYSKVQDMTKPKRSKQLYVQFPELTANKAQQEMKDITGSVQYRSSILQSKGYLCDQVNSFQEIFTKKLKSTSTVNLLGRATRMAMINSNLWIPVPDHNTIQVLNQDAQIVKNIPFQNNPRSITQATQFNNDIILASDGGLHIVDEDGKAVKQLVAGQFCDVSINGDKMAALEYSKKQVLCFRYDACKDGNWVKQSQFTVPASHNEGTILYYNNYLFVSAAFNVQTSIYHYTINTAAGQMVKEHQPAGMSKPFICGIDSQDNVLVANCNKHRLLLLQSDGRCDDVNIPGLSHPYDVICHENDVWILQLIPYAHYKLIKYTMSE